MSRRWRSAGGAPAVEEGGEGREDDQERDGPQQRGGPATYGELFREAITDLLEPRDIPAAGPALPVRMPFARLGTGGSPCH